MDKNIGKRLDGRYEITELIGVGGMADVYKAMDLVENRPVAVKILKKEFAENEEFLRRFRNESKAIAVLSHPNIVKIYDVGFTDKIQYIVMEYIDGITLKEYIENEKVLSWKDSVHFIIQILRALQHAHDRGIVHRDIKPQNIMMFTDGTIKVMDFGIAKFARGESRTVTDQAIGSVHYISPEQASGKETDAKSDIYSVGVMLYEMLTGQKPFDTDNPVSVAVMHMQNQAKKPREINPDIAPGLEEIILKAMEKDAANRYQSAAEMIKDIERFKADPSIVFGYYTPKANVIASSASENTATRFFKPAVAPADTEYDDENEEYDDEEYDEDEEYYEEEGEETAKSAFFPILTAVTIVVILVATFFVTKLITNTLKDDGGGASNKITVGSMLGMTLDEAKKAYPDLDIKMDGSREYSDYEEDKIFWQSIEENKKIAKGTEVKVKISLGKEKVKVPNVVNMHLSMAQSTLKSSGFEVEEKYAENKDVDEGYVYKSEPAASSEVEKGSKIVIYVSRGSSEEVTMTNVVGMTIEKATSELQYLGLKVKTEPVNSKEAEGKVVGQSIEAGKKVSSDTEVTLQVSTGNVPTSSVNMYFAVPSDASGSFVVTLYVNGAVSSTSSTINVAYTDSISLDVVGSETQDVTAELRNVSNGRTAIIGKYKVDFDSQSCSTLSEDIYGAFSSVGGIKAPETDPPQTRAPETDPPQTKAPETKAPETTTEEDVIPVDQGGNVD